MKPKFSETLFLSLTLSPPSQTLFLEAHSLTAVSDPLSRSFLTHSTLSTLFLSCSLSLNRSFLSLNRSFPSLNRSPDVAETQITHAALSRSLSFSLTLNRSPCKFQIGGHAVRDTIGGHAVRDTIGGHAEDMRLRSAVEIGGHASFRGSEDMQGYRSEILV